MLSYGRDVSSWGENVIISKNFLDDSIGCLTHTHTHTHMCHIIHVREISMLNAIYHYDEVRGEINPLYFSLLLYTFIMFYFSNNCYKPIKSFFVLYYN